MPRRRRVQQIAQGSDRLAVLSDHLRNVALTHSQLVDDLPRCLDVRDDDIVGVFDQLTQHKIEELLHGEFVAPRALRRQFRWRTRTYGMNARQSRGPKSSRPLRRIIRKLSDLRRESP